MNTLMKRLSPLFFLCILTYSCTRGTKELSDLPDYPEGVQAVSLLGDTLYVPTFSEDVRSRRGRQLAEAEADYHEDPNDADANIWFGRRTAYLGHYREAIGIYTKGMAKHPKDVRMVRHRGHRYITLRLFDHAIEDFERAVELIEGTEDEIEPDGMPNVRDIPTSTLHFNIWYHLGLAHYLKGEFENALEAYRECMKVSGNPDALVATSHWLYMTFRRLGRDEEASLVLEPIHAEMDIIENGSYHRLLLLYRGEIEAETLLGSTEDALDNATVGYGVGNWHYYNGRQEEAKQIFKEVLRGSQWVAFGYIAAEAEMSRIR